MKRIFEPLVSAWSGIIGHKLRSFLTILGVVIGVSAVIALMSVGKGTTARVVSSIESLGANSITISPGTSSSGGIRMGFGSASTLTQKDAEAIASQLSNISAITYSASSFSQVVYGSENLYSQVVGTTTSYQTIQNLTCSAGDFFTDYDYEHNSKVAVIGADILTTLFGDEAVSSDAIGQTIRLGNYKFEIMGVLTSKGSSMSSSDRAIIIPYSTLKQMGKVSKTTSGDLIVSSIVISAASKNDINTVKSEVTQLLEERHDINTSAGDSDDFTVTTMEDIISQLSEVSNYMTILLGAIAGISLLVGGIGVMNIMLVSVIERTREIGVRKALGAKEHDIWSQFLIEAVLLTFTGGIIGVGIGWGTSILVNNLLTTTQVTADIVILAVSVAIGIGLFFGFYPAWQASRLNPIEALRHE
jgi:putative ABC transport system permease protein